MKRFLVIESDTDDYYVFVHEVTREFTVEGGDKAVAYYRSARASSLVLGQPDPKFYGKLDALLVTADKLEEAEELVPEPLESPTGPMPPHVQEFLAETPVEMVARVQDGRR